MRAMESPGLSNLVVILQGSSLGSEEHRFESAKQFSFRELKGSGTQDPSR